MEVTQTHTHHASDGRSPVERLAKAVLNWWTVTHAKPFKLHILFGLLLGALAATVLFIGAVPTFKYGHDDFFFLENGWRAIHGLRPQIDYWSPFGPVISLVMALGLRLAHFSANGFGYANALVALVIGAWADRLGGNRLSSKAGLLFAVYCALLACAPYSLGESPFLSSHAMLYNRYGYALVLLVLLECVMPFASSEEEDEGYFGGASTGVAMGIAFFLKASFFTGAVAFLAASFLFGRLNRKRPVGLLLGFGAVVFANMAYLHFEFGTVLNALRGAAGARSTDLPIMKFAWSIEDHVAMLGLAATLGIAASFLQREAQSWLEAARLPILAVLVVLVDLELQNTNMQIYTWPLLPAFALLVASELSQVRGTYSPAALQASVPLHTCLLLLCGALFLPQLGADMIGLMAGAVHKAHPPAQNCDARFSEPRLSVLLLCNHPLLRPDYANGSNYIDAVNDGVALLHRYATPADKVLDMDMQNPFPFALGWAPPRGGSATTTFNQTMSAKYGPSFDQYYGDATVVMLPKQPAQQHRFIDPFYALYVPALLERYQLEAEDARWRLFRRKQPAAANFTRFSR
jgi:hypothetical protein